MAIRDLGTTLASFIEENNEFAYAHLIKFERPSIIEATNIENAALRFSYITDASSNVTWGADTYFANKVLKVGGVQESIDAKATSMSIDISSVALGSSVFAGISTIQGSTSGTFTCLINQNLENLTESFSEGDYVSISQPNATTLYGTISSFTTSGIVLTDGEGGGTITGTAEFALASEEVIGPVKQRDTQGYAAFVNREVYVYKALFDDEGVLVGEPLLVFKGLIASAKLKEDPLKSSVVSWSLTSHWGDFSRVNGRVTSDSIHRSLTDTGEPDFLSVKKKAYVKDFGFEHAETALNLISVYKATETRVKTKFKKGLLGIGAKVKTQEYEVQVDRDVDLRFNLEAKYLPVIYGVQRIKGIPIFADTLYNDSSTVFVSYALCEGEISGVYDVYFDNKNTICLDGLDNDTRSSQTTDNTIDVICSGRMDRGDVLLARDGAFGDPQYTQGVEDAYWETRDEQGFVNEGRTSPGAYSPEWIKEWEDSTPGQVSGAGNPSQGAFIHGTAVNFDISQMPIDMTLHTGKPNQKADSLLVSTARANNFKVQRDYYDASNGYWGSNHRLLDTAYVVAKYNINENETTIPSPEFIVKGKVLECYNYDFDYRVNSTNNDYVIQPSDWDAISLGSSYGGATLVDKYTVTNFEGIKEYRLRFNRAPVFTSGSLTIAGQSVIETWDRSIAAGSIFAPATVSVGTVSQTPQGAAIIGVDNNSDLASILADLELGDMSFSIFGGTFSNESIRQALLSNTIKPTAPIQNNQVQTAVSAQSLQNFLGDQIALTKLLVLDSNYSGAVNWPKYYKVIVSDSQGTFTQERYIESVKSAPVQGSTKTILVLDRELDVGENEQIPDSTYTYKIVSTGDRRVSINPVVQLVDYLTSELYGRGLRIDYDLNKESFAKAARVCDTRSDVTVVSTSNPGVGSIYSYGSGTSDSYFRGTVQSSTPYTYNGTQYYEITFEDVIGKLGHKWDATTSYSSGMIIWNNGFSGTVTTAGTVSAPTSTTSVSLTRVSGVGPTTLSLDTNQKTFDGNPIVKSWTNDIRGFTSSGYSLYDCDDVKYWRYMGWESKNQRHVTRHQTNSIVNTSTPVFDNINTMLSNFNGMLRYSAGQYHIEIKTGALINTNNDLINDSGTPISLTEEKVRIIEESDIIGAISVEDAGVKGSFNTVSLGFPDPQNRFDNRSVSYFNSDYLKEDRYVPKKADLKVEDITNFYNARMGAKQVLEESRYSSKINFTLGPVAIKLLPGQIISVNYSRFGWVKKLFRISNLTLTENCLVQVTAEEHNQNAYIINKAASPVVSDSFTEPQTAKPGAPSNLTATSSNNQNQASGGIILSWDNNNSFNSFTWQTEIWRSPDSDIANATIIASVSTNNEGAEEYTDPFTSAEQGERYYWVRHTKLKRNARGSISLLTSDFYPGAEEPGVLGTSEGARGLDAKTITLVASKQTFVYNSNGSLETPGDSITLSLSNIFGISDPYYQITVNDVEQGAFTQLVDSDDEGELLTDEVIFTLNAEAEFSTEVKKIEVFVKDGENGDIVAQDLVSVFNLRQGSDAVTIVLPNETHSISTDSSGNADQDSLDLSGTDIYVYIGATLLNYDDGDANDYNDDGLRGNLTWKLQSLTPTNVTLPVPAFTVDSSNTYVTTAGITEFAIKSGTERYKAGSIEYVISVIDREGFSTNYTKLQTFSTSQSGTIGANGRTVSLAGDSAVRFSSTGTIIGDTQKIYSATPFNLTDGATAYYQFYVDDTPQFPQFTTTNSFTINYGGTNPDTNFPKTIRVEVKEGSPEGEVVASDEATIISVQDGSSNVQIDLSNDNHSVFVSSLNDYDLTGSGTELRVYEGSTLLRFNTEATSYPTTNSRFNLSISVSTGDKGITRSFNDVTGFNSFAATIADYANMVGTTAQVTFTAYVRNSKGEQILVRKAQSLSIAKEGTSGKNVAIIYAYKKSATQPTDNPGAVLLDLVNATFTPLPNTGWEARPPIYSADEIVWVTSIGVSSSEDTVQMVTGTPQAGQYDSGDWSSVLQFTGTPGLPGASAEGPNALLNLVLDGVTTDPTIQEIYKKTGTPGWNASVRSNVSYTAGASATLISTRNGSLAFGLNGSTDLITSNYQSIDYQWILYGNFTAQPHRQSGIGTTAAIPGTSRVSYNAGDSFTVLYDNRRIKWFKNGALVASISEDPNKQFYFDSSFYTVSNLPLVSNFAFQPSGASALNSAIVKIQKGSNSPTTAPEAPGGTLNYDFATQQFTSGILDGWQLASAGSTLSGEYIWETSAIATAAANPIDENGNLEKAVIVNNDWGVVQRITGLNGGKGATLSVFSPFEIITYDSNEALIAPTSPFNISATYTGGTSTATFSYSTNGGSSYTTIGLLGSGSTRYITYTPSGSFNSSPSSYIFKVVDGDNEYFASISIASIQQGPRGQSVTGPAALKTFTANLYYRDAVADNTDLTTLQNRVPDDGVYNFDTASIVSLLKDNSNVSSYWSFSTPAMEPGAGNEYYFITISATEDRDSNENPAGQGDIQVLTPTARKAFGFSGLVTFSDLEPFDVRTTNIIEKVNDAGGFVNTDNNTTRINGGIINTNTISAVQLLVSNDSISTKGGIYIGQFGIKISDSTGAERVRLGRLDIGPDG